MAHAEDPLQVLLGDAAAVVLHRQPEAVLGLLDQVDADLMGVSGNGVIQELLQDLIQPDVAGIQDRPQDGLLRGKRFLFRHYQ